MPIQETFSAREEGFAPENFESKNLQAADNINSV